MAVLKNFPDKDVKKIATESWLIDILAKLPKEWQTSENRQKIHDFLVEEISLMKKEILIILGPKA